MRVAIVTSRFPYPLEKGDKLRIYHFAKGLAPRHEVHIFCINDTAPKSEYIDVLQSENVSVSAFILTQWSRWISVAKRSLLSNLPAQVAYFSNSSLSKEMNNALDAYGPDIIFCHLPRCAEYVMHRSEPKLLDYMDAFSTSYRRIAATKDSIQKFFYLREAKKMRKYEQDIALAFDSRCIISRQDANALSLERDIQIVQNGVDLGYFEKEKNQESKFDLLFVGNLGYEPNITAIEFLINNILPVLNAELSYQVKVLIAGARPDRRVLQYESEQVKIWPWVQDIRTAYSAAKVFVAPLFSGAGQQNKILEALAMKLPCVTTDLVINGISSDRPEEILQANSALEFVKQIKKLLADDDYRKGVANAGRQYVEQYFSWDAKVNQLEHLIQKLLNDKSEI